MAGAALALQSGAQMIGPGSGREANREAVKRWTATQRKDAPASRQVWPGVAADTEARTVTVVAEAVGIRAGGYPVEFLLVGEASDRDYESLAVSLARPSDVARALEAVGLPRGRPVHPQAFRFWPRGERVTLAVRPFAGGPERPVGAYVFDRQAGRGMSNLFTYVGSVWREDGSCEADEPSPGAILSTFNTPATVLDMPFAVTQNAAYGRYAVTDNPMEPETLWCFVLRPERAADAPPLVVPVDLAAQPRGGRDDTPAGIADLEWVRRMPDGAVTTNALDAVVKGLMDVTRSGREPHVTLRFDDRLTVRVAAGAARVIAAMDGENGARVDGPADGQLYYKAFLPQQEWREREKRLMQPYELRVARDGDGGWSRRFVHVHEDWSDETSLDPKLTVHEHALADWEAFAGRVGELGRGLGTLLVFAPEDAPLSAFMEGVRRVRSLLPTVYVFGE